MRCHITRLGNAFHRPNSYSLVYVIISRYPTPTVIPEPQAVKRPMHDRLPPLQNWFHPKIGSASP